MRKTKRCHLQKPRFSPILVGLNQCISLRGWVFCLINPHATHGYEFNDETFQVLISKKYKNRVISSCWQRNGESQVIFKRCHTMEWFWFEIPLRRPCRLACPVESYACKRIKPIGKECLSCPQPTASCKAPVLGRFKQFQTEIIGYFYAWRQNHLSVFRFSSWALIYLGHTLFFARVCRVKVILSHTDVGGLVSPSVMF